MQIFKRKASSYLYTIKKTNKLIFLFWGKFLGSKGRVGLSRCGFGKQKTPGDGGYTWFIAFGWEKVYQQAWVPSGLPREKWLWHCGQWWPAFAEIPGYLMLPAPPPASPEGMWGQRAWREKSESKHPWGTSLFYEHIGGAGPGGPKASRALLPFV